MRARVGLTGLAALNTVLAVTLAVGLLVSGRADPASRAFLPVEADRVTRVRISGVHGEVDLVRADTWDLMLDGHRFPARFDRAELFLEGLERSRILRSVTGDRGLHDRFGVDDEAGRPVTVETDQRRLTWVAGDPVEPAGHLYVREADSDLVLLLRSNLDFYLRQSQTFWAYLRLFPEDARPAQMVRARLSGDLVPDLEFVRSAADAWLLRMDGREYEPDARELEIASAGIVDFVANGFYVGDFAALVPAAVFSFTLADGRRFSAEIRGDARTLVARPSGPGLPGDPYGGLLYTISRTSLDRLGKLAEARQGD